MAQLTARSLNQMVKTCLVVRITTFDSAKEPDHVPRPGETGVLIDVINSGPGRGGILARFRTSFNQLAPRSGCHDQSISEGLLRIGRDAEIRTQELRSLLGEWQDTSALWLAKEPVVVLWKGQRIPPADPRAILCYGFLMSALMAYRVPHNRGQQESEFALALMQERLQALIHAQMQNWVRVGLIPAA